MEKKTNTSFFFFEIITDFFKGLSMPLVQIDVSILKLFFSAIFFISISCIFRIKILLWTGIKIHSHTDLFLWLFNADIISLALLFFLSLLITNYQFTIKQAQIVFVSTVVYFLNWIPLTQIPLQMICVWFVVSQSAENIGEIKITRKIQFFWKILIVLIIVKSILGILVKKNFPEIPGGPILDYFFNK